MTLSASAIVGLSILASVTITMLSASIYRLLRRRVSPGSLIPSHDNNDEASATDKYLPSREQRARMREVRRLNNQAAWERAQAQERNSLTTTTTSSDTYYVEADGESRAVSLRTGMGNVDRYDPSVAELFGLFDGAMAPPAPHQLDYSGGAYDQTQQSVEYENEFHGYDEVDLDDRQGPEYYGHHAPVPLIRVVDGR